jgi:hypothetical protein
MSRVLLAGLATALPALLAGCFSAQPGAEGNHSRIQKGMTRDEVFWELGKPKDAHPIPGQGDSAELPVEQWCYQWNYTTGKTLTVLVTAFIGLFFMDFSPYGFDVGFDRSGRVRTVSEVGKRRR